MALAKFLNANNALSTITVGLAAPDTVVQITTGSGDKFPAIANEGEFFMGTFTDGTGALTEIVKVTARVGDVLTVVRGQEGTAAQAWAVGTRFEQKWTAFQAQELMQNPLTLPLVEVEFPLGDDDVEIDLSDYDGLPFVVVRMDAAEDKTLTDIGGLTRAVTMVILQVAEGSGAVAINLGAPFFLSNNAGDDGFPGFPGSTISFLYLPDAATYRLVETARTWRIS